MILSQPALPTIHAFAVQFRAQFPGTPMAWDSRVEHVVSRQATHFHALEDLLTFMRDVLAGVQQQLDSSCTRLTTCPETTTRRNSNKKGGYELQTQA